MAFNVVAHSVPSDPPPVESFDLIGIPPEIFQALRDLWGSTSGHSVGVGFEWNSFYNQINAAADAAGLPEMRRVIK